MNIIIPEHGIIAPNENAPKEPKLDWSTTIDRYWRHKETQDVVEVQNFFRVDGKYYRVIYRNPEISTHDLSLFLNEFKEEFEPMGNTSSKF